MRSPTSQLLSDPTAEQALFSDQHARHVEGLLII